MYINLNYQTVKNNLPRKRFWFWTIIQVSKYSAITTGQGYAKVKVMRLYVNIIVYS